MNDNFHDSPGELATPQELKTAKGRELHRLLAEEEIEFAQLVECKRDGENDVVVFDVEVELGQLTKHSIRPIERIAAVFEPADDSHPEALALRHDFPAVPHLNIRILEFPRSLCLYEQPYEELRRLWTASKFVERIRIWLALTAKGKLHDDDQPLEPLLWGSSGKIVLPSNLLTENLGIGRRLRVIATSIKPFDMFLIAEYDDGSAETGLPFVPVFISCPPRNHGIIRFRPRTVEELARMVNNDGFSLLSALRDKINESKESLRGDEKRMNHFLDSSLIIFLALPKTRQEGGAAESTDLWAFLTALKVRDVGVDIGSWMIIDGHIGNEPFPPEGKTGANTEINLLNPHFSLSAEMAASFNGCGIDDSGKTIAAIGAGALGSQVLLNARRMGLNVTSVIDDDRLLPHNLARHAMPRHAVGYYKAEITSSYMNALVDNDSNTSAVVANVLRPNEKREELEAALKRVDVILDMSASVAVSRWASHDLQSNGRRVSIFLNPTGTDLIVLAEDAERKCPLDMLEMQYYRSLFRCNSLDGHFVPNSGRSRYGQSCRDITSRIPQDAVATHAGVATRALRKIMVNKEAQISVWRTNEELEVSRVVLRASPTVHCTISDWTVYLDEYVISELKRLREAKLPNETGGILIGSFDLERKIAYVVDTIPSPPDSEEWPTLYIRGSKGLRHEVETVVRKTDGALQYVGEWHSHPSGCSTLPSGDDMKVFSWLTDRMRRDGFPGLMMIVGEHQQVNCFIGKIKPIENLLPLFK